MRRFGAAVAISVLLVTSACSGGSRPSESEVSNALQKGASSKVLGGSGITISKKAADCIAKLLVDSGVSDRALQAIVDGSKSYHPSKADTVAATQIAPKIVKCLPAGLGN